MEDSEQRFGRKCDQEEKKVKMQLKVAAWAVCKELNITNGEEQNMVHSVCATTLGKRLQSEELKTEYELGEKFFTSSRSVDLDAGSLFFPKVKFLFL